MNCSVQTNSGCVFPWFYSVTNQWYDGCTSVNWDSCWCSTKTEFKAGSNDYLDCYSTPKPTSNPTPKPTSNPTKTPTQSPSRNPSRNPTQTPTRAPTRNPTKNPTISPTKHPTISPTKHSTISPTFNPTKSTRNPSISPSVFPTLSPTFYEAQITTELHDLHHTRITTIEHDNNTSDTSANVPFIAVILALPHGWLWILFVSLAILLLLCLCISTFVVARTRKKRRVTFVGPDVNLQREDTQDTVQRAQSLSLDPVSPRDKHADTAKDGEDVVHKPSIPDVPFTEGHLPSHIPSIADLVVDSAPVAGAMTLPSLPKSLALLSDLTQSQQSLDFEQLSSVIENAGGSDDDIYGTGNITADGVNHGTCTDCGQILDLKLHDNGQFYCDKCLDKL